MTPPGDRRVVVVTGGGGGIGAAIAEELGRRGDHVVTVDPLVTLDGAEQLPAPEAVTAQRITVAGGSAQASAASVTDAEALRTLFQDLVRERGRLDAVVNVAGISRPTGFASGSDDDWRGVLEVHLDGYRNVLEAALPIMAKAGRGRILGVTSGSGWRPADAGAYSCAKRAVAALTWQLGRATPPGVVVNAISPIAVTRMVTEALKRAQGATSTTASGGLSLGSMPQPEDLGPLAARMVADDLDWCRGQIVFAGGSEVALVEPPRLLEIVRTDGAGSLAPLLDVVVPGAFARAEADQASHGGGNPRFDEAFAATGDLAAPAVRTCAVVSDRSELAGAICDALDARGVETQNLSVGGSGHVARSAELLLRSTVETTNGPLDAVVVAFAGRPPLSAWSSEWQRILTDHDGLVGRIHSDAAWARAVADHASAADHPIRLVTVTDALSSGGRSRAQAAAQLARASRRATDDRVAAFAVSMEATEAAAARPVAELVAHLVAHPEAPAVSGAELAAGPGWLGLRSHPRPTGSISLGEPTVPGWLDAVLRDLIGAPPEELA